MFYEDLERETITSPYYKLDNGKIYDKNKMVFVDEQDDDYKSFLEIGGEPLSINNGYTLEQLKEGVLKFYGWEIGDCLLTLEELKQRKMDELEAKSALFEENLNKDMYFTSSLKFKCNGDRRTRSNIEDLIAMLSSADPLSITIEYRDYDNVSRTLTKEQLQTLLSEHKNNGLNIYHQKWAIQDKIAKAKQTDELHNLVIKFDMMDFSK